MVEETIDARYTLVQSVLEAQLTAWFGKGNFKIIEPPDDYAKWKVEIPRKLEHRQKVELHQRFIKYHSKWQRKQVITESFGVANEQKEV